MTDLQFMAWVGAMNILQFHAFCGTMWSKAAKRFLKWDLWPGVRAFPGQREVLLAFELFKLIWVMKARQLGLSESAAFYAFFVAITEPRSEIIVISKKLSDAEYFLKRRVLQKIQGAYALEQAPGQPFPWPTYHSDTGKITFANGSWIEAVSSDNEEVRSRSPRLIVFDEIRSYRKNDAEELWSAILPAIESDPRAQAIGISTAKFGTWFNEMTKNIMAKVVTGIKFLFLPDDTHPQRTPAWRADARKKWSNQILFLREHPMKPEHCFISREGAVWPQFEPHAGGKHVNPVKIDFRYTFVVAYDHGRQHPAVFLMCLHDKFHDHLYVFDELFCRGMELPDVCFAIRKKLKFYEKHFAAPTPQVRIADSACFNKTGQQTVSDFLRSSLGMTFQPSVKHDMEGSIDLLSARFSYGQITIDPRCENTIRQVENLTWKYEAGETRREKPVDVEDDAPDLLRYICVRIRGAVKPIPQQESLYETLTRQEERTKRYYALKERPGLGGDSLDNDITSWQSG